MHNFKYANNFETPTKIQRSIPSPRSSSLQHSQHTRFQSKTSVRQLHIQRPQSKLLILIAYNQKEQALPTSPFRSALLTITCTFSASWQQPTDKLVTTAAKSKTTKSNLAPYNANISLKYWRSRKAYPNEYKSLTRMDYTQIKTDSTKDIEWHAFFTMRAKTEPSDESACPRLLMSTADNRTNTYTNARTQTASHYNDRPELCHSD